MSKSKVQATEEEIQDVARQLTKFCKDNPNMTIETHFGKRLIDGNWCNCSWSKFFDGKTGKEISHV